MPVNSQQYEDAKRAIGRRLDEANNINGAGQLYMAVKNITPKGFRGSILKFVDWPTSWGVLVGLSPAQISQNREATLAARAWQSTSPTGTDNPSFDRRRLFWKRLLTGYFAANTEVIPESDFPRWRKPSWMTEGEAEEIRELIRTSYQGEAPLEQTMPVEDTPTEEAPTEAELAQPMPTEPETPQMTTTDEANLNEVYEMFRQSLRYVWSIDGVDNLRERMTGGAYQVDIRRNLRTLLILKELGYSSANIFTFVRRLSDRGFIVQGVRLGRSVEFQPYAIVDTKAYRDRPSRYQSRLAYEIMAALSGYLTVTRFKEQFEVGRSRFQVMRYTGSGRRMSGYQGISLKYKDGQEVSTLPGQTIAEAQEAIDRADQIFRSIVDADSTTTSTPLEGSVPPPTVEGAETRFYYVGSQSFSPRMTYQEEQPLYYDTENLILRSDRSYAFYFVSPQSGQYKLYRSVFSPMRVQAQTLSDLKQDWSDSGQLSEPRKIKVVEVSDVNNKRRLRQMILQAHDNTTSYVSSTTMRPVRSSGMQIPVEFDRIKRIGLIQPAFTDSLRQLAGEEEIPQQREFRISQSDLKAIGQAQMLDTNNVGFEFEGGHASLRMTGLARAFNSKGILMNAENYNHQTRPKWKLVPDGSLSGVPNAFELVSPILRGQAGLENLRECLRVAEEVGCEIYRQGGVHIHFEYSSWDLQTKKNILINQYLMSPWLQATQPKHRRASTWAKLFKSLDGSYESWKTRVLDAGDERQLTRVVRGDRYYEINITNTRQPTWEWRFPQGNIEIDTNLNMVRLLDKIIEVSKKGLLSTDDVSEEGMKTWMGTDLFTFWRNRIYDMSQTGTNSRPSYNHRSII